MAIPELFAALEAQVFHLSNAYSLPCPSASLTTTVLVQGKTGSSKSTFINDYLDGEVCPVGVGGMTRVETIVRRGDPANNLPECRYHPAMSPHIVFIDTPGHYTPADQQSDLVLFFVDETAPTDQALLDTFTAITTPKALIVGKFDTITDPIERFRLAWRLGRQLRCPSPHKTETNEAVFVYSSREKSQKAEICEQIQFAINRKFSHACGMLNLHCEEIRRVIETKKAKDETQLRKQSRTKWLSDKLAHFAILLQIGVVAILAVAEENAIWKFQLIAALLVASLGSLALVWLLRATKIKTLAGEERDKIETDLKRIGHLIDEIRTWK